MTDFGEMSEETARQIRALSAAMASQDKATAKYVNVRRTKRLQARAQKSEERKERRRTFRAVREQQYRDGLCVARDRLAGLTVRTPIQEGQLRGLRLKIAQLA